MKDRGRDFKWYDSLFGKFMPWYCLTTPLASMRKHVVRIQVRWGNAKDNDDVDALLLSAQGKPLLWENGLILAAVTHFYPFMLELSYKHTHTLTSTHAVMHQWRRKQRHLEKLSSGRLWHDLRELIAFPITLGVERSVRRLPSAFTVASDDGCSTNWWTTLAS